jgi:alpha-glucosidase
MEFPTAGEPLDLSAPGEFMWGGDLLVAPPRFPEQPAAYEVRLPGGGWFDYWTGRRVTTAPAADGTTHLSLTPDLKALPVYVRAGAIVPHQPLVQSTAQTPQGPLRLDVYPGPDCRGSVYQDAGDGFGFQSGQFYRASFRCETSAHGVTIRRSAVEGRWRPWWTSIQLVLHEQGPARAASAGQALSGSYDGERRTLSLSVTDDQLARGVALTNES